MTILDRSFARLLAISLSIALLAAWLAACDGEIGTQIRVPYAADDHVDASNERNLT